MDTTIRIDSITAYSFRIPLTRSFRISVGEMTVKEGILFEGRSGGICGWGEAAVDRIPFYTTETVGSVLDVSRQVFCPLLLSRSWSGISEIVAALDCYRGHRFAKAALEAMCWDIRGKQGGRSVAHMLGGTRAWVETGPSVGMKPSPAGLVEAVAHELEQGFHRIKIKVAPGKDDEYIQAVRTAFPAVSLMVDANSAYHPADLARLAEWDQYNLLMIEQPFNEHDLHYHAQLCARMTTPVCLDESIETPHLADCAMKMHAADIVNIKVCRVGGLTHTLRIHDLCAKHQIPVWIGSRLGSGVATAARLAAASLPNASFPTDAGAERAYVADDLLTTPLETRNGCELRVPSAPGLGIEVDRARLAACTTHQETQTR
ncbi:o-succinylbenzoate synthase [bacterium]|nr:o-succinylbenzoate synthase [bacterium]